MRHIRLLINKMVVYLKSKKIIRVLAKPYVDWKTRKSHNHYVQSPDCYYLKTLKGIHAGERCFIIGNGPSLNERDLNCLCNEYTFAANRIFNIFSKTEWRPTYYMSMDDRIIKEVQDKLKDYKFGHIFLESNYCNIKGSTNYLTRIFVGPLEVDVNRNRYNDTSAYVSEDVSDHFCGAWTVTFGAIQLAIYMGFKEIYLLGVDHNYSTSRDASGKLHVDPSVQDYFDNQKYDTRYDFGYLSVQYAYEIAKEYCDNHNIKIYNATRGGKLEVFERVDFDELMGR